MKTLTELLKASGFALACGLALSNCASSSKDTFDINKPVDATKPVSGAEASNAEKAYRKGLEEKGNASYIDATKYFEYVRNNFPYSQYAALSELALADMAYERDDYAIAAADYQDFVKSHPSHPKADYASFRIGLAHFQDKSSEAIFYPPAYEKDQGPVRQALEALQKFEHIYPHSELLSDARKLMDECRQRLAAHVRYVADFYWKRKAWKGASGRYLELADSYGDLNSGHVRSDALWRAAQALGNSDQPEDERVVLQRVIEDAPTGPHRQEAEKRLARLQQIKAAPLPPDVKVETKDGAETPVAAPAPAPAPKIDAAPSVPPPPTDPTAHPAK